MTGAKTIATGTINAVVTGGAALIVAAMGTHTETESIGATITVDTGTVIDAASGQLGGMVCRAIQAFIILATGPITQASGMPEVTGCGMVITIIIIMATIAPVSIITMTHTIPPVFTMVDQAAMWRVPFWVV